MKKIEKKREHANAVVRDIEVSVRKRETKRTEEKKKAENERKKMIMREGPPPLSRLDLKGWLL